MWQAIKEIVLEFCWRLWGYFTAQPLAKPSTAADEKFPDEVKRDEIFETIHESELWTELQKRNS